MCEEYERKIVRTKDGHEIEITPEMREAAEAVVELRGDDGTSCPSLSYMKVCDLLPEILKEAISHSVVWK